MTSSEQIEAPSSEELTARVRAVDGVTDVFPSAASLARIPIAVTALISGDLERMHTVAVSIGDGTLAVTARVGTGSDASTPDIARGVADELLAAVGSNPGAVVDVQVARIH